MCRTWNSASHNGSITRDGSVPRAKRGTARGQHGSMDVGHKAEQLESGNRVPVEINFIPFEPVSRRDGVRMMIVMPPISETDQRDQPIIRRRIAGLKATRAPNM